MVDVSAKPPLVREATAQTTVKLAPETLEAVRAANTKKGDVLAVARIAGIQAAKQTSNLIPLCHPLPLSKVGVDFELQDEGEIVVTCLARTIAQTGVEMEALTGASLAALTIYDMCKGMDKDIQILDTHLIEKTKVPIED